MNESETNPNMPKKCAQCGSLLPAGALDGLCPACLLEQGAAAETASQPEVTRFQPPSVSEVSRLFPQLEILGFIGKGGMGAVYKARQPALDRFVALKILPPQTAGGPGFGERFNREARALAKLNHPNIVTVHEFGQANGLPFFVMEYVDGLNLRQLEQAGNLSPREALQIVPQICEALQFAHDEGIVHRDIKPENILLDKRGRVKIADFGIAKIIGREERDVAINETTNAIGTPHYMAPEQVEKPQTVDHRADIFSLGVVFYEMLTGELPLGKFALPSRSMRVDVRLDEVVLRALEKEPERRYQQASQVKTDVETIASGSPARNLKSSKSQPAESRRRIVEWRGVAWVWALACAIVTITVLLLWSAMGNAFKLGAYLSGALILTTMMVWVGARRSFKRSIESGLGGRSSLPRWTPSPIVKAVCIWLFLLTAAAAIWAVRLDAKKSRDVSIALGEHNFGRQILSRLRADGISFQSASMTRRGFRIYCGFVGLRKELGENKSEAIDGGLIARPIGGGLWSVEGHGQLSDVRFTVDVFKKLATLVTKQHDLISEAEHQAETQEVRRSSSPMPWSLTAETLVLNTVGTNLSFQDGPVVVDADRIEFDGNTMRASGNVKVRTNPKDK